MQSRRARFEAKISPATNGNLQLLPAVQLNISNGFTAVMKIRRAYTYKGSEGWTDQCPREKPRESSGSLCRSVDVANGSTAYNKERCSLKCGHGSKDEVRRQIGRESCCHAKYKEQKRARGGHLGTQSVLLIWKGSDLRFVSTHRFPSQDLAKCSPKGRGQTHEKHKHSVACIDYTSRGVERGGYFWHCRKDRCR